VSRPLLSVRDLEASYDTGPVLHGIDLDVEPGEIVVILGANGAGKTTTLRAISQMVETTGSITFEGSETSGASPAELLRRGIAHVPQGRGTFSELTVDENLRIGAYSRTDDISADLDRWYTAFERLAERRTQPAGSLSGGEQQMLAIARALMSRPRLLLLDEPSLGLAPMIVRDAFEQITQLNTDDQLAVLLVEQNAQLAFDVADRGYVLEAGRIVAEGTTAGLRADDRVRQAYLGRG